MAESTLQDIINELKDAHDKLKEKVESQLGKIETTDWSNEYAELTDVLNRLIAFSQIPKSDNTAA